jgi:membrane carboxypeptidase/penicillin-binding protein
MRGVVRDLQVRPFVPPKNITFVRVNRNSGGLTTPDDPDSFFEAFKEGTEPKELAQITVKAASAEPPAEPGAKPVPAVAAH